jgi:hypothetical protein
LEDCFDDATAHRGAYERRTLSAKVADLDATRGIDRDRVSISGVLGLRTKLYWLAWLAHLDFEASRRAGLVIETDADHGEG